MIGWNKEKLVFVVSVAILVLVVASTIPAWQGSGDDLVLTAPVPVSDVTLGPVPIDWFSSKELGEPVRDPFEKVSTWRTGTADPLPPPTLATLARRVPLPAPVADSARARLPRERKPPEVEEDK